MILMMKYLIQTRSDIFLMQLEIPVSTVEFVAEKASCNGNRVILNPAPAQKSI